MAGLHDNPSPDIGDLGGLRLSLLAQLVMAVCSGGAMAYAAYILTTADAGPPQLFAFDDKVFHAVCFAALAGPGVLVLPKRYLPFWMMHFVVFGAGIEFVQAVWIPARTGSVGDFLADVAGILAAVSAGRMIRRSVLARMKGCGDASASGR